MTHDNLSGNRRHSVPQRVCRAFAQAIPAADVGEGRARIGVSGEVLQVNDVGSPFAVRGESRHSE